ncbi:MAG: hypothetical protein HY760_00545 [Nitrospirae bacterium]|nr:hypothetical protein [Nitrospirota bacterium]
MAGKAGYLFDLCEEAFVKKGKSLTEIGERFCVSPNTLTKWRKKGGWDNKRKAILASPRTVMEMAEEVLRKKLEEVVGTLPDRLDAGVIDGLTKLIKNVERLRKEYKLLDITVLVMDEFVPFVKAKEPDSQRREAVFAMVDQFLSAVSGGESWG